MRLNKTGIAIWPLLSSSCHASSSWPATPPAPPPVPTRQTLQLYSLLQPPSPPIRELSEAISQHQPGKISGALFKSALFIGFIFILYILNLYFPFICILFVFSFYSKIMSGGICAVSQR